MDTDPYSSTAGSQQVLGDCSERDPPVPIPNTEVKPLSPDGTARASVWESRTLPRLNKAPSESRGLFCVWKAKVSPRINANPIGRGSSVTCLVQRLRAIPQ